MFLPSVKAFFFSVRKIPQAFQTIEKRSNIIFIPSHCYFMDIGSQGHYCFKVLLRKKIFFFVSAISQALTSEACRKPTTPPVTIVSCDHCPMVWYHKLCSEIEGLSERASQVTILRKLELLPEEEQTIVQTKLQGALDSSNSPKEQIELLMMILRAHCESKQSRHVHDTPENRLVLE
jgi:TBC1 domain-containing protein 4